MIQAKPAQPGLPAATIQTPGLELAPQPGQAAAHCLPPTAQGPVPAVHCALPTGRCPLPTAHCKLLQQNDTFAICWTLCCWNLPYWLDTFAICWPKLPLCNSMLLAQKHRPGSRTLPPS